jgi:hypothetical protein
VAAVVEPRKRESKKALKQSLSTLFACIAFLILVIGLTYFAWFVVSVEFGEGASRANAYRELGYYISGERDWYRDARIHAGAALVFGLASLLLGRHPFARITVPVACVEYVVLHFFGDEMLAIIREWAQR